MKMIKKDKETPHTDPGLVLINTGNGKGKSTAAFGQALRAAGQGMRVCIVQFIKGNWETGEVKAFRSLGDKVEMHVKGSGFTWQREKQEVTAVAREAFSFARQKILSDSFDMVILDELTYLINYGMIPEKDVLDLIRTRPARLHLVITGREAGEGLIAAADIVSEMREVKHLFAQGGKARKGIEF